MRVVNGCGHQNIRLIRRITEHQTLIAGTLIRFVGFVRAHCDISGLLSDGVDYCAGVAVEADI